ncbi:MAG: LysR family transcriptional regulator [Amphritea sp.]
MNHHLDLELVRTFLTVVSLGGLKNAARQLNKTPSAISMQLKKLETELGHRLLDRNNKGIALTEAGRTLKKHGEKLIKANNTLLAELRSDELKGIFTFGAPTDYGPAVLQRLLPVLRDEFPMIQPKIVLEPSRVLRQRVKAREIDIAIVAREPETNEGQLLWKEDIAWFGAEQTKHAQLPVAILSTDCVLRDLALNALSQLKPDYQIVLEAASVASLIDAVDAEFSHALLPTSLAQQLSNRKKSTALHLTDVSAIEFALITSSGLDERSRDRLQQRLAEVL